MILQILDAAAADYVFPMLDNGYVYPAAARMSAHHLASHWALVIEVFGYSPRAGDPDIFVTTFASHVHGRSGPENFVDRAAYDRYLSLHPHDEQSAYFPLDGDWHDPDHGELVAMGAKQVQLRGRPVAIPARDEFRRHAISLDDPSRIHIFELCRYLASIRREDVLATPAERRAHVPPELAEVLVLEEWNHPDLAAGQLPSQSEAFRQMATVLATGDVSAYRPTLPPNTHWSNWPDGGSL